MFEIEPDTGTIKQIVTFFTQIQVHNKNNIIQKPTFSEWLDS